jgi:soluble lytic murein transglycosylase-like protein
MNPVQKAIVPGILIGVFTLVGLSRLVTPTLTVSAATEEVQNTAVQETQSSNGSCEFQVRYPAKILPWCTLIEAAADKYGMDALLIAAVMLQESGGQPEVMSGSGAVGLMQVMPRDGIAATFQCINGPCFTNRPSIAELKDPAFNVDYGVRMLAGLNERHGDIREALKSYGPYDVGYQYADKVLAIRSGL